MRTLLDYIPEAEKAEQNGLPCKVCGSSDALSITINKGDTGAAHCFSCQWGGSGAQYLAEGFGIGLHDALVELGAEDSHEYLTGVHVADKGRQHLIEKARREEEERIQRKSATCFNQAPGEGYTITEVGRIRAAMSEEEEAFFEQEMQWANESDCRQLAGDHLTKILSLLEEAQRGRREDIDRADTNYDFITEK